MSITAAVLSLSLLLTPTVVFAQGAGAPETPPPPTLTFVFELHVQVAAPQEFGEVPGGRRRIIEILGGTFEGPNIRGRVLPGGADWQLIRPDGFAEIDTRYALETDEGQLIYIQNAGMRHAAPEVQERLIAGEDVDPALVYFRTAPVFETSAPELQWLTRHLFVSTADRHPEDVVVRVWMLE